MPRHRRVPTPSNGIIAGWDNIAALFGVHRMTARRWAKLHGLPVITSPNGGALTSMTLIDLWLLSRMPRRTIGEAELAHAVADMTAALQASPAALAKVQAAVDAAVQDAVSRAVQAWRAPLGASQRQ